MANSRPKPAHDHSHRHPLLRPLWMRRFRRRHRWLVRAILSLPFGLALATIVLTRTAVTRVLVMNELSRSLNVQAAADSAIVRTDGRLIIDRARFRTPGIPGPAGQLLSVTRIEADVDWWSIVRGGALVRHVSLIEPVVTISQSLDDHSLNIEALAFPASAGSAGPIPPVKLERAGIQIGEHSAGSYSLLRHVVMDGRFYPDSSSRGAYKFELSETSMRPRRPGGPSEAGFAVTGRMVDDAVTVTVENFTLDDWPAVSVPTPVRPLFQELDLRGEVRSATLFYDKAGGISATLALAGVGMNLPVEPDQTLTGRPGEQQFGPPPRLMRIHGVSGGLTFTPTNVTATVDGLVEDLPCQVQLSYGGTSLDAPFSVQFASKGFRVQRNPDLLPYAPPAVRKWLQVFSSPVATVDTAMTVRRGPPKGGVEGDITVDGWLELHDGVAAYAKFPYAFAGLSGRFEFDTQQIKIVRVEGASPSGARLVADGRISPLDDTAEVTINIDVKGADIDDAMEAAMGPGRGELIPRLFNKDRHRQLLDAGLIQTSESAARVSALLEDRKRALAAAPPAARSALAAEVSALEAQLRVPLFDFRGKADVKVWVHSPLGRNVEYQTHIDITLPKVGLIPERFPLPIEGRDVTVRIENDIGRLTGGTYRAVGGGTAEVAATFSIPSGDEPVRQDITLAAAGLPISELLINALPGEERPAGQGGDAAPEPGGGAAVKRMLRDLKITGSGGGRVRITNREDEPGLPVGFDADLYIADASVAPSVWPGAGPMRMTGIAGRIAASEYKLRAELAGIADAGPGVPAAVGPVRAAIDAAFPPGDGPATYRAEVACNGLELAAPVETMVGVFSKEAASRLADLRAEHQPAGAVDVLTIVESGEPRGPARTRVELSGAGDLNLRIMGRPAVLQDPSGRVIVTAGGGTTVGCSALVAPLLFDGQPSGTIVADGRYDLTENAGDPGGALRLTLGGARFESSLIARVLEEAISPETRRIVSGYRPRGGFDLHAEIRPPEPGGPRPRVRGRIEPKSLEIDAEGTPVVFEQMGGAVEFDEGSGQFRQLSGQAADWSFRVDGAWETDDGGGLSLLSEWSGSGTSLTPDLRALLPEQLRTVLADLSLKIEGPWSLNDARLTLARGSGAAESATGFSGALSFLGGGLDAGLELRDMNGRTDIAFERRGDLPPVFNIDLRADRVRAAGIPVVNARAIAASGAGPGAVTVPLATGECFGGRVAARAEVAPASESTDAPRRFEAAAQLSGVRFSPLMEELATQFKAAKDAAAPVGPAAPEPDDLSRGVVDAELSINGAVGRPDSRRGRGSVRISGGRILSFPFMMRLIEVSNLALPGNSRLSYAAGSFYVDGGLVTFDDLAVISSAVEILGHGTMTWPGKVLDLRFNSRAARPIPVLSPLVQRIRDELVTTTVRGTLGDPDVSLQQFPGTRRMLGRDQDPTGSGRAKRITELHRRSRAGGPVAPSSAGGIPPTPPDTAEAGAPADPR